MLIVQKFGGSSLADPARLRLAAEHCLEAQRQGHRLAVVVSAAGDGTDALIDMAHAISPSPPLREMDALISTGEQQSAALMAIQLHRLDAPARSFSGWQAGIRTEGAHGAARIAEIRPARLEAALEAGFIPVVAGFQGLSAEGEISTLGRGGSDTTAAAMAAALGAGRCEIYTDVDGVYTADPRLVPGARRLEAIDYRDMLALAEAGAQVLHPASVRLAMEKGLDLRLLSTFEPGPGTALRLLRQRPALAGVTRNAACGSITLAGRAADLSLLPRLRSLLAEREIPLLRAETAEDSLSLFVPPDRADETLRLMHDALFA